MAKSAQYGSFVPTTNVWDVAQLQSTNVNSPEFKELLVRLYQNVNNIANVLNGKDSGIYNIDEFVNGQKFFGNPKNNSSTPAEGAMRQVLRKVINFGALPDATVQDVPHYITCTAATSFTRIYATATDPSSKLYIPIPFVDTTGTSPISLSVDDTNVYITTLTNLSAYTICYVVLEYIQT